MFELHTKNVQEKITLQQLPTLRQSFVVASLLVVIGIVLAHFIHEGFIFISLLVAGGLMFSGLAGFCPMVLFLQKMPWNK